MHTYDSSYSCDTNDSMKMKCWKNNNECNNVWKYTYFVKSPLVITTTTKMKSLSGIALMREIEKKVYSVYMYNILYL